MEIPLNAIDEPLDGRSGGDDDASQSAPAFTIPVRGNSVSLSSLLSSESDHNAHFAGDVAPISLPQEQSLPSPQTPSGAAAPAVPHRPRARSGLSALMNSPMDDDVVMQDPRGYIHASHTNSNNSSNNDSTSGATEALATTTMTTTIPLYDDVNDAHRSPAVDHTHAPTDAPQEMEVDSVADGHATTSPRSTSDSPVPLRQRRASVVDLNVQSVVLSDSELESVKRELQSAIQRFLAAEARGESGAPSAKRQKKGKHARSKAKAAVAPAADESFAEVQRCIQRLHRRASTQFESASVLRDVVQLCLSFCAVLHEKDAIDKVVVVVRSAANKPRTTATAERTTASDVDFDATLAALALKPLYFQLLAVVRYAVMSCSDDVATALLSQVLEWCRQSRSAPHRWLWVFAFIGELHGFATLEFLVRELVLAGSDSDNTNGADATDDDDATLPVIEYLAAKNPAQIVDIVRDLLEDAAAGDEDTSTRLRGQSVAVVLAQLVRVATRHALFLRACDDNLQFIVTRELVTRLVAKLRTASSDSSAPHGSSSLSLPPLLLQLVVQRATELQTACFHLLLLLHELSTAASPHDAPLAAAAIAFHSELLVLAERTEPPSAFLRGLHRYLSFMCQAALRGLYVSPTSLNGNGDGLSQHQQRPPIAFEHWSAWLELLARHVSTADVTQQLVETDLMLHEVVYDDDAVAVASRIGTKATVTVAATIDARDVPLCRLLAHILTPQSPRYVEFIQQLMASCSLAGPRVRQRRVLAIVQALLRLATQAESDDASSLNPQQHSTSELPLMIRLLPSSTSTGSDDSTRCLEHAIAQLTHAESWCESWQRFALWRGAQGVTCWERVLDLACARDRDVAARALALVAQTPFASLEDPAWQYRCLRKLTTVFFELLRQHRRALVRISTSIDSDSHSNAVAESQHRLETLQTVLFRLLALDGAVAHYASSVFATFAALWVDALLSTSSPTSIPTHFPAGATAGTSTSASGSGGETDYDGGADDDDDDSPVHRYGYDDRDVAAAAARRNKAARSGALGRVVIRSERTISSKCTNLQASQVITAPRGDALVYREALDVTWEREMDAAHTCALYATDVLRQLLRSTVLVPTTTSTTGRSASAAASVVDGSGSSAAPAATSPDVGNTVVEQRLQAIVDLLLERALPCCGIPSDDAYKETLPNRSSFDVDLRIEQWLHHFPAFLPLLRVAVTTSSAIGSRASVRLLPVLKAALVVLIGHWHSVKGALAREHTDVPPYLRNRNQLALTCALVRVLQSTNWLPLPLARTAELLPLTSPADICGILFSCWFYLSDHPPVVSDAAPTYAAATTPVASRPGSPTAAASSPLVSAGAGGSAGGSAGSAVGSSHANVPLEFYLVPLRKALHANIRTIGAKYPLFMC